jgi:hypothetical protein
MGDMSNHKAEGKDVFGNVWDNDGVLSGRIEKKGSS